MTVDFDGSQILLRQAKARVAAARRFAAEAEQLRASGGNGLERRRRELDAVITTLILIQAAAESYANWVHIEAIRYAATAESRADRPTITLNREWWIKDGRTCPPAPWPWTGRQTRPSAMSTRSG